MHFSDRRSLISWIALLLLSVSSTGGHRKPDAEDERRTRALHICQSMHIIDGHIDWPERLYRQPDDISRQTVAGDYDLVRARKGGLDAACSVVYVDPGHSPAQGRLTADSLLRIIDHYPRTYPDKFAYARTPADIPANTDEGRFSIILAMENAAPMGKDLAYLDSLKEKGFAYITLCHGLSNQISDSSYDPHRPWKGISPLGREVIRKMNRLGIMIDISHSTDSAVFQCLRYSEAPIIASHSSCRHFTPEYERNLSDTLIKGIAANQGMVMINFGSMFLDSACLRNINYLDSLFKYREIKWHSKQGMEMIRQFSQTRRLLADSKRVADHIDHVVQIAGIDHVGIGSDYDGVGPTQPADLPDVSSYPVLVEQLLTRGYTEKQIRKILAGNFLRVWRQVLESAETAKNDSFDQNS